MKTCTKCGEMKPATTEYFYRERKDRLKSGCKSCMQSQASIYRRDNSKKRSEVNRKYRENNKEKEDARHTKYRELNKDRRTESNQKWREKYKERILQREKLYRKNNRAKETQRVVAYRNKRYKSDPLFRLTVNLRNRVRDTVKQKKKSASALELLGCSVEEVKTHLEKQFRVGMSWENYGDWHIDHIRPCASFDLTDAEQQKKCFHYSNLQPLWAAENLSKGSKWEGSDRGGRINA